MPSLPRLIHEVHRRSLWQVLGIYLAVSWLVLQVVDALTETAGLPDWVPPFALVLLLIGLPVVLATAFVQEGVGGGGALPLPEADAPVPANLSPGTGGLDLPSTRPSFLRRQLTWKRALLGGAGAFGVLVLMAGGYFALWSAGIGPVGSLVAQGLLEEGEAILLADFAGPAGAVELGDVVTEALRVDLQESRVLRVLPPAYVSDALVRMGRERDATLTADVAREMALRDGVKAVIAGEVAAVGGGYLLTASLVAAESGEILSAFRVPAATDGALLTAIDRLSQDIRERAGESLRTIRQGTPLELATTSSLDALRLYTRAVAIFDQGRILESIPLLEEAIALDPEFAMALRKLSVALNNAGLDPDRMRKAGTEAYELRRRLSEREAGLAEAWYHDRVRGSNERAIEVYRRILERYPDDLTSLNNLAVRLLTAGRYAEAEAPLRRAVALPAPTAHAHSNLIQVLWNQGNSAEALEAVEAMAEVLPDAPLLRQSRHWIAAAQGRWEEAHDIALQSVAAQPGNMSAQVYGRVDAASYDLGRGWTREAAEHLEAARRASLDGRVWAYYWEGPTWLATANAYLLDGPGGARAALDRAMREVPLDSVEARHPSWPMIAGWLALAGEVEAADSLFGAWERSFEPEERGLVYRGARETFAAFRARGVGDDAAAAAAFRRLHTEIQPCAPACLFTAEYGRALEGAGRTEEAIAQYEAHLANAPLSWHGYLSPWTPLVLERLGALYEARGETERARAAYRQLAEQFGGADEPLAGRARRARDRAAALSPAGGG